MIVDDERTIRCNLASFFNGLGYQVETAENGQEALELFSRKDGPDVVLTDFRMAQMNGYELLKHIKARDSEASVILMTAYATVEGAVGAMKAGAYDYLTKPFSLDQVEHAVKQGLEARGLRAEVRELRDTLDEKPLLESRSGIMRRLLDDAKRVSTSDAAVLLIGESGTGKNILAQQIHYWSARHDKAFVMVNCTTLTEQLLESELFGHTRGAFTGAIKDKPGRLEAANGGTVFLDEIAELSSSLQAKFLRFVQEQRFERVGGERTIHVEARIIAASNRDLAAAVSAHHFREDLFYRLNVITLRVPALRERREDILPLAERFLAAAAVRARRQQLRFSPEAEAVICSYHWPGNVRELRNAVERAVVLSIGEVVAPESLPDGLFQPRSQAAMFPAPSSLEELEREQIIRTLAQSPTLQDAAEALGINATTLWRKRKRYHLG